MKGMKTFWLGVAVVGFALLLPLILPAALASHALYARRLRSAASRFACTGCGQLLGNKSIELAGDEWAQRMTEMRLKHPNVKFRMVRHVHAICSKCGKQYRFLERARGFEEAPMKSANVQGQ